ncbi:MAG: MBL fold metallo-hydrolase [Christensenellaceae bacterium]|nr:MBL fold metallo-hydrolase [Christensenellaceae bacterium]MBR3843213.1 MBL fold metallo-hydrolase [Christensenellaceae bacterium]
MMELLYTANCGVLLKGEKAAIGFDLLHEVQAPPFSKVPEETFRYVLENEKADVLFYSHIHPDHFGEEMNRAYAEKYHPAYIMPEHPMATLPLAADHGSFEIKNLDLRVEYCRLLHSGDQYKDVINYGFLIEFEGKTILSLGDASLTAPEIPHFLSGKTVDLAFINFPFYTLSSGRDAICNIIKPKNVIIQHLPFESDDRFAYRKAIEKRCYAPGMPPVSALLTETLQKVNL